MHPHALHVSACICMYPHVQPMSRPSDPHPVAKLLGSNIRPVHMPSGLVSRVVANPTQHPHPNRCVRPAAPQHPSIPPLSYSHSDTHRRLLTYAVPTGFSVVVSDVVVACPIVHSRSARPWPALHCDFPLGCLLALMYPPLPFRRIFLLVFFPFSIS